MTTPTKPKTLTLNLRSDSGESFSISVNEAEAAHWMHQAAQTFGWTLTHNPFTDDFLKTLHASMNIADKIEGGG